MKVIVFGAAGEVGRRIVWEALERGHEVTAVTRNLGKQPFDSRAEVLVRDVLTANDIEELVAAHDLAISALRPPEGYESALLSLTKAVVLAARLSKVRFLVVGGAASLQVPEQPGQTLLSAPGLIPDHVRPIAEASQRQYQWCLPQLDSRSTYLCPPAELLPGERTGTYRTGTDSLVADTRGRSLISMEDFAVALLDEVETPRHGGSRFTVGY